MRRGLSIRASVRCIGACDDVPRSPPFCRAPAGRARLEVETTGCCETCVLDVGRPLILDRMIDSCCRGRNELRGSNLRSLTARAPPRPAGDGGRGPRTMHPRRGPRGDPAARRSSGHAAPRSLSLRDPSPSSKFTRRKWKSKFRRTHPCGMEDVASVRRADLRRLPVPGSRPRRTRGGRAHRGAYLKSSSNAKQPQTSQRGRWRAVGQRSAP